jgi:hypothetical protein
MVWYWILIVLQQDTMLLTRGLIEARVSDGKAIAMAQGAPKTVNPDT